MQMTCRRQHDQSMIRNTPPHACVLHTQICSPCPDPLCYRCKQIADPQLLCNGI